MVEVSRDGRRVYVTNSLYRTWDEQFYPDGIRGWLTKVDTQPGGGIALDHNLLVETSMHVSLAGLQALGAFHGLNPGMGWLFAVALGMHERRRSAVWRAMLPLAFGSRAGDWHGRRAAMLLGAVGPLRAVQWAVGSAFNRGLEPVAWPAEERGARAPLFPVAFTLSMPFWLMRDQPWKAQVVIVGGTLILLVAFDSWRSFF